MKRTKIPQNPQEKIYITTSYAWYNPWLYILHWNYYNRCVSEPLIEPSQFMKVSKSLWDSIHKDLLPVFYQKGLIWESPKPIDCGNGMSIFKHNYYINTVESIDDDDRYKKHKWYENDRTCFETLEQAKAFDQKLQLIRDIRIRHAQNDNWFMPDWSDVNQQKTSIEYNHEDDERTVDYYYWCQTQFILPYFSSNEKWLECIKHFWKRLELLK